MVFLSSISTLVLVILFLSYYYALGFNKSVGDRQEATQRLTWSVSALLFSASTLLSLSVSIWVVIRHWDEPHSRWLNFIRLSICILTFAAAIAVVFFDVAGSDAAMLIKKRDRVIANVHNAAAVLAVGMVICGVTTLIDGHSSIPIDILSRRLQSFRVYLLSTSALLTIGVFEVSALFRWKQVASSAEPQRLDDLAGAVSLAAGLLFSALLMVVFLPVVAALSNRFDQLAAAAAIAAGHTNAEFSFDSWRIQNQLGDSPLGFFSGQLAILFPGLAGLLSKSIQRLLTTESSK